MDQDLSGWDLWEAARDGDADRTREILLAGVHPDEPSGIGDLALCAAAEGGFKNIVRMLLEAGANPDKKDERVTSGGGAVPAGTGATPRAVLVPLDWGRLHSS